jgi:uncharacterized protein YbaR (Trm112 family)
VVLAASRLPKRLSDAKIAASLLAEIRIAENPFMPLIDAQLKEILVCPCPHHAALEEDEAASQLRCTHCQLAFAVRDGIPIMMLEEAIQTPEYQPELCGAPDAVKAADNAS